MSDPFKVGPFKAGPSDKCPMCGKPPVAKFAPFCTQRCADLDLGRWLKGSYVIPAAPDEAEAPDQSPGQVPDEE